MVTSDTGYSRKPSKNRRPDVRSLERARHARRWKKLALVCRLGRRPPEINKRNGSSRWAGPKSNNYWAKINQKYLKYSRNLNQPRTTELGNCNEQLTEWIKPGLAWGKGTRSVRKPSRSSSNPTRSSRLAIRKQGIWVERAANAVVPQLDQRNKITARRKIDFHRRPREPPQQEEGIKSKPRSTKLPPQR